MWPFRREKSHPSSPSHSAHSHTKDPATQQAHEAQQAIQGIAAYVPMASHHASDLASAAQTLERQLTVLIPDLAARNSMDMITAEVDQSYQWLKNTVGRSPDVILRRLSIGHRRRSGFLAYVDGMTNTNVIDRDVLEALQRFYDTTDAVDPPSFLDEVEHTMLGVNHVTQVGSWKSAVASLISGNTLLFLQGVAQCLVIDTVQYPSRQVGRAQLEPSLKGSQEAFNEVLLTQMNLIRRHIPSTDLEFEAMPLAGQPTTRVVLAYIVGLTNPQVVASVKERLRSVTIESIQTANEVSEYLADRQWSIFPQVRQSERVDLVARNLMQGKVAICVANDPFVLILPNTLMDFYQTTQDYASPFWDGSLMRVLRFLALFLGLFLMPLYISLTSVNPSLLPIKLLLTLAGGRQGIPFPPVAEVIIMWVIIEVLREAANRLPQQLATTIGTVGAVVVGTAIVKAGIVDDVMIITVTLTALSLYTTPSLELTATWRWLFWMFIVSSWFYGIYGIVLASVLVLIHLVSLDNYGVPYLTPFGPLRLRDLLDSWIRAPFPTMKKRPVSLRPLQVEQRQDQSMPDAAVDLYAAQKEYRS